MTLVIAAPIMVNDVVYVTVPAIRADLGVGAGEAQLAVSLYILTFAVAQLFYGPLSDHYGRRPVLIASFAVYAVAAVLCALAGGLGFLVAARILQGIGAGAGPTLARAVLRDVYGAERAGPMLSYVMAAFGLIAVAGPGIGGVLVETFGWPSVFVLAACYGVLCLVLVWRGLAETAPLAGRAARGVGDAFRGFAVLLRSRIFTLLMLANTLIYGAMFAWFGGSVLVMVDGLGLGTDAAGGWFALSIAGFVLGAMAAGRLGGRTPPLRLFVAGSALCLVASATGAALALAGVSGEAALIAPGFALMLGIGLSIAPAIAAGIAPFPEMAGAASALISFVQMAVAALIVQVTGLLFDGTAAPLMVEMTVLSAGGLLLFAPIARHAGARVLPR